MDNERKKYIITYVDRKTGKIKTDRVEAFTNRNVFFIRRNQGLFNYLYAKAQEILSTDVSSRYHTHYIKKRNGKLRRIDEPDEEEVDIINKKKPERLWNGKELDWNEIDYFFVSKQEEMY